MDNVPIALYFGGLVLLFPLVLMTIQWRRYSLLASCHDQSQSMWSPFAVFEVELRVRQLLMQHKKGSVTAVTVTQLLPHAVTDADAAVYGEAAAMYQDAVARMKDSSFICILQAQFLMYDLKRPLLARRALLLSQMRKPTLDIKFVIFKSTKHLEETAFQEEDIIGFVTGEKYLALSRAYDKRCCLLLADFWKGLG